MTPSQLKHKHQTHNPDSHFFTRSSMRFFGDTMRNYGCYELGDVWVLWRKQPVKHGLQSEAHFCKRTFKRVK